MKKTMFLLAIVMTCVLFGACDEQGSVAITTAPLTTTTETTTTETTTTAEAVNTTLKKQVASNTTTRQDPHAPTTTRGTTRRPTRPNGSFDKLDFRTDIRLQTDKQEYEEGHKVTVTIQNTTGESLEIYPYYFLTEQNEDGTWTNGWLSSPWKWTTDVLAPGETATTTFTLRRHRQTNVNCALVCNVGDDWIRSDAFYVKPSSSTTSRVNTTHIPTIRTTIRTRPGYTYPTIPDTFREEELRTDVKFALGKTTYYFGEGMTVYFENTTDHEIGIDPARAVLKKGDNGEWEYVYQCVYNKAGARYLDEGETYKYTYGMVHEHWTIGLAGGKLGIGDYKLIWAVDGKWVGTDFTIVERPASFSENAMRTDLTLELDKTLYLRGEETHMRIQNTTDHDVVVHNVYCRLSKDRKSGEWIQGATSATYKPTVLKPGEVYERVDKFSSFDSVGWLGEGSVGKVAILVDDGWVAAEFAIWDEPETFTEEIVRTDVTMELDKTIYQMGEEKHLRIQNTTDHDLAVGDMFVLLKKSDSGEWKRLSHSANRNLQILKPGEVYERVLKLNSADDTARVNKGTEFKLAWPVDDGWLTAEFAVEVIH